MEIRLLFYYNEGEEKDLCIRRFVLMKKCKYVHVSYLSPFSILLLFRQRIDAVFGENVHIPAKTKHAVVRLRKIKSAFLSSFKRSGTKKGKLPPRSEGHPDRDVLTLGPMRVVGSRVMMERFPIRNECQYSSFGC